ncbi:adenylate/guanylate cyclase domain-containing protein [Oscillatoriales cyanobacterium LEGE 11467]|uniref:Adenylate/guanylate cyclase domain-containing protein n=1 Tax=Zarconia navalis LEGE 11467 TaxID=1828826 RepID=A0A928Z9Z3_9CYAN|nr:adenylate/guanylate cyclase domain-containing protein [Zarconia navalis]MBE9042188.1 adenylate/guanylate cyclase domain-containing protein [Zarconia navalis LEGE 11467]
MTKSTTTIFSRSPGSSLQTIALRVIAQESLKNETKVAYVKVVVVLISFILDVIVFFFPQQLIGEPSIPLTVTMVSFTAFLISAGFLILLRHQYSWQWLPRLQIAIPLFDGLLLALFITNIWRVMGESNPQIITNVTALCCLMAITGAIRISRQASVITTILGCANFVYAIWLFQLDNAVSVFALFTILGTGLLGMLNSSIVRRQGKNEAGRLLMEQFLPANVVEAAFESPMQLLEEPRIFDVTIMVSDLRSFTKYSEKLEPGEVFEFLNELQGLLSSIVERHGGWVDKFMGDGMLAVFGAPKTLDNHALQALAAAREILANVDRVSPLPVGLGLHSGPIVAGCLGTGGHLEFTVIGDTVNVASRLESLTKEMGCALLISHTTQQHLTDVPLRSLGKKPIRGRDESLEIFGI